MDEQARECPLCAGNATHLASNNDPAIEPWDWYGCMKCSIGCRTLKEWNRRAPGPATATMIDRCQAWLAGEPATDWPEIARAFIAEWGETAIPPTCAVDLTPAAITVEEADEPEQSPWKCAICDEPIRIGDDFRPHHTRTDLIYSHRPMISDEDRKILVDSLGLKK